MPAWIVSLLTGLGTSVVEMFCKLIGKKKEESAVTKAEAKSEALNTVGKSVETEKKIETAQKEVAVEDKDKTVAAKDGGLRFDDFNASSK